LNVNGKKSRFVFSLGFNISLSLKHVRKVSYKQEKDGNCELVLVIPADHVKVDLGFRKDNNIGV